MKEHEFNELWLSASHPDLNNDPFRTDDAGVEKLFMFLRETGNLAQTKIYQDRGHIEGNFSNYSFDEFASLMLMLRPFINEEGTNENVYKKALGVLRKTGVRQYLDRYDDNFRGILTIEHNGWMSEFSDDEVFEAYLYERVYHRRAERGRFKTMNPIRADLLRDFIRDEPMGYPEATFKSRIMIFLIKIANLDMMVRNFIYIRDEPTTEYVKLSDFA